MVCLINNFFVLTNYNKIIEPLKEIEMKDLQLTSHLEEVLSEVEAQEGLLAVKKNIEKEQIVQDMN